MYKKKVLFKYLIVINYYKLQYYYIIYYAKMNNTYQVRKKVLSINLLLLINVSCFGSQYVPTDV